MPNPENLLPPLTRCSPPSTTEVMSPVADASFPAVISQSRNTCTTFAMDDGSPTGFSLDLRASTPTGTFSQPSEEKPLVVDTYCEDGILREENQRNSPQLTSFDYIDDQDELSPLTSQLSSPIKQHASSDCIEQNRVYFPAFTRSPATGASSSVDGIKKASFIDDLSDSESFITRSSKPNASRRSHGLHALPPLQPIEKSSFDPASATSPRIQWVGRGHENASATLLALQTFKSFFLRMLSLSSASNTPPELRTPTFHPETGFPRENHVWKIVKAIPRLVICFMQYLLSPWIGWLSLPEFLTRKKSYGDPIGSVKYRRKKLMSSISIVYGLFCLFMFSNWILLEMGFHHEDLFASKDLNGDHLNHKSGRSAWANLFSFIHSFNENRESSSDEWDLASSLKRRLSVLSSLHNTQTPLSMISHTDRFNKFHSKSGRHDSEEVAPLLFQGTNTLRADSITACMFTNQFWLDRIPLFVKNWDGPVSLVVECFSSDRMEVVRRIEELRGRDQSIKQTVDFHLVTISDALGIQRLRNVERMLVNPVATNAQLNLARFFSRSDMVWLVGDARVLPPIGLVKLLSDHLDLRSRVLDYGDAIIIPNFAFNREKVVYPETFEWDPASDLNHLAQQYINELLSSILLPSHQWPATRQDLLNLATESRLQDSNLTVMTMFDQAWAPQTGPSNWTMWKEFATARNPEGILATEETSSNKAIKDDSGRRGGQLYPILHYDLKYAPNVIVSREGQPWCTERFEYNKAACVYQMYLTGTELWVMPEAWSMTIQQISEDTKKYNDDEVLKELISSRLYSKFHQEACMHYGREFSSLGAWEDDRSKHARAVCMHVLNSWGVGTSSGNIVL